MSDQTSSMLNQLKKMRVNLRKNNQKQMDNFYFQKQYPKKMSFSHKQTLLKIQQIYVYLI